MVPPAAGLPGRLPGPHGSHTREVSVGVPTLHPGHLGPAGLSPRPRPHGWTAAEQGSEPGSSRAAVFSADSFPCSRSRSASAASSFPSLSQSSGSEDSGVRGGWGGV